MGLAEMIEAGTANPVLLLVFALVLGELHGLEPGHSKTMKVAYIVAAQGTVKQTILLGVSAAFSHSIIVWVLAIIALTVGNELIGEQLEPWFIVVFGVLVLGVTVWMLWQTRRPAAAHSYDQHHHDDYTHDPQHAHDHGYHHHHDHGRSHGHTHRENDAHVDVHARAHAAETCTRLAHGRTGTRQTILFVLSGGLITCPTAITVFILCLHLGQLALGMTLVSAFSIGHAVTLVAIGLVAAVGLKAVCARTSPLDGVLEAVPWISAALIACIGLIVIWSGLSHLHLVPHTH